VGRFVWMKCVLAAVAFWASGARDAVGAGHPAANPVNRSDGRGNDRGDVIGEWSPSLVTVEDDVPRFRDPARLAPLPPGPPRPHAIPAFDWRPPLPAVDGAEALHKIEADEGILNPPKRKPRYLWPDWMRR
jgi:hypothetical protein